MAGLAGARRLRGPPRARPGSCGCRDCPTSRGFNVAPGALSIQVRKMSPLTGPSDPEGPPCPPHSPGALSTRRQASASISLILSSFSSPVELLQQPCIANHVFRLLTALKKFVQSFLGNRHPCFLMRKHEPDQSYTEDRILSAGVAFRRPAPERRHADLHPGLVDEHRPARVDPASMAQPPLATAFHVRAFALIGNQRLS